MDLVFQEQLLLASNGFQVFVALVSLITIYTSKISKKIMLIYTLWIILFVLLRFGLLPNQNVTYAGSVSWLLTNTFAFVIPIILIKMHKIKLLEMKDEINELKKRLRNSNL